MIEDAFDRFQRTMIDPEPELLRILMVGDVMGKPGRKVFKTVLHRFRETIFPDLVTMNAENSAGGFGITTKIHDEMLEAGVDVFTMGNHWKDKADVHALRRSSRALVLPQNLKDLADVQVIPEFPIRRSHRMARIVNLMGQFAMKDTYENPFLYLNQVTPGLATELSSGRSIVLVDFHGEASSEKQAVVWKLNGICAAFVGTHTHTPTSDERVTAEGTAFLTDVGMTGPYASIIGMDTERTLNRYFSPDQKKKPHEVATDHAWFCGFLVQVCPVTGLAKRAHRLQYRSESGEWIFSTVSRGPSLVR